MSDNKGYSSALDDFNGLNPENIKTYTTKDGERIAGDLENGTKAIVRDHSSVKSGNAPTLEIQNPDTVIKTIKIRY
ncbi:MAG: hypothetical protein LBI13_00830 [Streptococcaceae bacterium]|nr:hypothetical protein [Streptococcaceae bacterium]